MAPAVHTFPLFSGVLALLRASIHPSLSLSLSPRSLCVEEPARPPGLVLSRVVVVNMVSLRVREAPAKVLVRYCSCVCRLRVACRVVVGRNA
jgi:hypothetical protein